MTRATDPRRRARGRNAAAAASLLLAAALPAAAVDFQSGDFEGSVDTTISYGLLYRLTDHDPDLVGIANGGTSYSCNTDDGDLNYGKGIASHALKLTSEVEVKYGRFGAFVRGFGFYDDENQRGDRERTPLSDEAKERVGSRAELRDAFLWAKLRLGGRPVELRLGEQVVSWGESTFIQGSINTINPVDVSALRVPGAELREALLPVGMLWGSFGLTDNLSAQAYYQYDWEPVVIEPTGSFFSVNDYAGPGGDRVMLGFGADSDQLPLSSGRVVPRDPDRRADDGGEYGVSLRALLPSLDDTELGLYYIHYTSRLPIASGRTGSAEAAAAGRYVADSGYFIEYPEDIDLLGASFNTLLGRTGVALQGEVSYRMDAPLQVDDVEILAAALSPVLPVLDVGQLGGFPFDADVPGYVRRDVGQVQVTATKILGQVLGADETLLIGEVGLTHVFDMPGKDELRLDGPATETSGNPFFTQIGLQPATEDADAFPDATSWGYRLAGRATYENAVRAVGLQPFFAWQHDVGGISPGPGGNFLEGRMAGSLGCTAIYQNAWALELSYNAFFGAGDKNLLADRDFLGLNVKYSF